MKKNIKSLTPKQQKLVQLLKSELLKRGGTKTMQEMMLLAGYSPNTADKPQQKVLDSPAVQNELKPFIDMLGQKAKDAFSVIDKKKLEKGTQRDAAYVGDIVIKNKQLLSGKETERKSITVEISEEIARKNQ